MTQANYIDIILNGYYYHKDYLAEYFNRECKKAEQDHVGFNEFFRRVLDGIQVFINSIKDSYYERLNEWHAIKSIMESKDEWNEELEKGSPEPHQFSVHLASLTKNRFVGHLWVNDLDYINKAVVSSLDLYRTNVSTTGQINIQMESLNKTEVHNSGNGNITSIGSSTITATINVDSNNWDALKDQLESHGIDGDDINELNSILTAEKPEGEQLGNRTISWIMKVSEKAIKGVGKIAATVSSSLLASLIKQHLGM